MNRIARFVAFAGLLAYSLFAPQWVSQAQGSNTWSSTGQMTQARSGAAAALLTDGQILITGGTDSNGIPQTAAEVYNPATGAFTALPAMNVPRANHAAVVLVTGDVLVTGGLTTGGGYSDSAEIFSVSSQQWTLLNSSIGTGLSGQTMATLSDGNILIAGGTSSSKVVGSIVLYNFTDKTFTPIATLLTPRTGAVAAATPDGRVLIAGGTDIDGTVLASTEIFVYSTMTGTVSAGPNMTSPRVGATATSTYDGVAVIGGNNGQNDLGTAEIFSQWTNTFQVVSGGVPRSDHFAALLPKNGSILATGGTGGTAVDLLEPWANSTAGAFFAVAPSLVNQDGGFASPVGLGSLLAAGGMGSYASAAELYLFPTISTDRAEYPPGTPVVMTGAGFQPFEEVTLHIHEWVKQSTEDDPDGTATADTFGNFTYNKYAPDSNDVGARYHLTAVGMSSGYQAQTIFGDSITSITFTSAPLDQATGVCGAITLSVTEKNGTYGQIYLYDSNSLTGTNTGTFYSDSDCISAITPSVGIAGAATVNVWYENNTAGSYLLYADNASGGPGIQCTILTNTICGTEPAFIYSGATQLSFSVQPGGGGPNAVWAQQPVVVVQDKNGDTVTSGTASTAPITLTLSTDPGGGVLSCASNPVTASSGVATFSQCSINLVENTCYMITASSPGLTSAVSGCFFISTVASASNSTVTASPTPVSDSGVVQNPCTTSCSTITVTLKDSTGNPVSGKAVTLTPVNGNSTISAASGVSNASGVVTFTVTDTTPQTVTYTAADTTDNIVIAQTASVTFTLGAVSAGKSTVSASLTPVADTGVVQSPCTTSCSTITVTLNDSTGNPVSGKTVTLVATACTPTACTPVDGSSVIATVSGTTNSLGQATFTVTDTVAQVVTYTATDTSDTTTVTQTVKVTFAAAATTPTLTWTSSPPNAPTTSEADGAQFTISATSDSTGRISYSASGGCTNTGATVTMTSGTTACVVTATVAAAAPYTTASISATVTATLATSTVTISCPPSVTYNGTAQTQCVATATGAGGLNQSLTVTYINNTNVGQATASATFGGDASHTGNSNTQNFQILAPPTPVTISCPASEVYTGTVRAPCTAIATLVGEPNATLTVTYMDGGVAGSTNAGTVTASASYAGDANNTPGSNSTTFAILQASSSVVFSCPASVTYTGGAETPCTATATGPGLSAPLTVSYSANQNVGTASANASYAGDTNHLFSSSSTTFTITAASATATAGSYSGVYNGAAQSPSACGLTVPNGVSTVGLTCTNSPSSVGPGVGSGTVTPTVSGSALTDFTITTVNGTWSITAAAVTAAAGSLNGTYNGVAQVPSACVLTGAYTGGLTCTNSPASVGPGAGPAGGGTGTVTPTVTGSTLADFTITPVDGTWIIAQAQSQVTITCPPTVVFNGAAQMPCTATVTATGTPLNQSLTLTAANYTKNTAVGQATVTASYPSNANYAGSSTAWNFTIIQGTGTPTTTTVSCPPSVVYNGLAQTPCTATVTGSGGLNQQLPSSSLNYSANTNVGTVTVSAGYAGSSTYAGSSGTANFAINPAPITATAGSLNSPFNGSMQSPSACMVTGAYTGSLTCANSPSSVGPAAGSGTVTPTVSGSGQTNFAITSVTGSWTITSATGTPTVTTVSCPPTAPYTGSAITPCTAMVTGAGGLSQSLTVTYTNNVNAGLAMASASYAGNATYAGSSNSASFTITQASLTPTVTTVSCPPSVVYSGLPETPCTATVTGAGGLNQSLTVTYSNNINTGTAMASASYAGNATYAASSNSTTFTITTGSGSVLPTTTTITCPPSVVYNAAAQTPCTATVTGLGGLNQTLTVTYTSNINAGTATASASYAGDANYTTSSNSANFTIAKAGTSTTLSASSSSVGPGQAITLTAQVVSLTSGTPTGSVAFYDGTTLLGTSPLTAGTAALSTSSLNGGAINSLNAVYSGDTNFTPSQSSTSVSVGSLDFTLAVSGTASLTVVPGGVATYKVIANPLYGSYPGPVSFTSSGLPMGATITFSPSTIAANAGQQTVTLTVSTPAVAMQVSPTIGRRLAPLTLALLLFPLLGVRRLRRHGRRLSRLASLLLLLGCTLAGALMTGCSSAGSGFFTQAVQSYTINVTATSGNVQHAAAVTLVVE
jgi:hypothetical protein